MNKTELTQVVSQQTKLSKKGTREVVNAMISEITKAMAQDDKVQLVGFGTFACGKRNTRTAVDLRSKKPIKIPACRVPSFKAGKALKDALR